MPVLGQHTLRLSMKKPFGDKRHYAKQSMQVETIINMVSVEGVSVRGFRGLGVFKGTCFTRSRAYHNLLWWSPHPRHTSAPLGLLLLLAQIEFFWFPEQTKIDTGDFWDAGFRRFSSNASLLPPHSASQTSRCPPASVVPNYSLIIFHVLNPTPSPELCLCWSLSQSLLCTPVGRICSVCVYILSASFSLVTAFWCQFKT